MITNAMLYQERLPFVFSLSLVKAAQRSLTISLHATFGKEVKTALVTIAGELKPDKPGMSPSFIAERIWELHMQPKDQWTRDLEILER